MAVATVFNSTGKVKALLPELKRAMSAISRFEPQILGEYPAKKIPRQYNYIFTYLNPIAQGKPGHWATYQNLDYQAYSMWVVVRMVRDLPSGNQTAVGYAYLDYYNEFENVRAQYYRDGYGKQPRD